MEKSEILKVLKSMRTDWNDSEKFRTSEVIFNNHTKEGFCLWLEKNKIKPSVQIVAELQQDLYIHKHRAVLWYATWKVDPLSKNIFRNRIEHLNRTIGRLEKEIKPLLAS